MKLMPRSRAVCTTWTASASLLPVASPRRLCPPQPNPITLTVMPVRPRIVYCIEGRPLCPKLFCAPVRGGRLLHALLHKATERREARHPFGRRAVFPSLSFLEPALNPAQLPIHSAPALPK